MRGRWLGLAIMVASLSFGALYAYSFLVWAKNLSSSFGQAAWSWWVIALPVAAMMAFAVFFSAWIGWVMVSSTEAKRRELLNPAKPSPGSSECTGAGDRNRS